jgi:hypothetical protein
VCHSLPEPATGGVGLLAVVTAEQSRRSIARSAGLAGGVVLWLTPEHSAMITRLRQTGLYGSTQAEVIRTLMVRGIEQAVIAGTLKLAPAGPLEDLRARSIENSRALGIPSAFEGPYPADDE